MKFRDIKERVKNDGISKQAILKKDKDLVYRIDGIQFIQEDVLPEIISVINKKGGVAKTTSAVHISFYLSQCGFKVLLIDLDDQDNCKFYFKDIFSTGLTSFNLFNGKYPRDCIQNITNDLSFIKADRGLSYYDNKDKLPSSLTYLKDQIELIKNDFDFIIIDNPPNLDYFSRQSIFASTKILIPILSNQLSLSGSIELMERTKELISKTNIKILGIFLTKVKERTTIFNEIRQLLKTEYPDMLFDSFIPESIAFEEIVSLRKTIFEYSPNSKGASAYRNLVRELCNRL